MRNAFFVAAFLLFAFTSAASAVDSIADVKTLADLRKLPVIHTDDGWDVQVGLADPGEDAGPYRLIYCLANRKGPDDSDRSFHTEFNLGPLGVELAQEKSASKEMQMMMQRSRQTDGPYLFAQALPVGWVDDLTVRVLSGKSVLLERKLGTSEHRLCYWTQLLAQAKVNGKDRQWAVNTDPPIKCPRIGGWSDLLDAHTAKGAPRPAAPEGATLPGGVPLSAEWMAYYFPISKAHEPLSLTFKDDLFTLDSHSIGLVGPSDDHLLARWWVNDKPIAIDNSKARPIQAEERAMQMLEKQGPISFSFGLPGFLGMLKSGDQVGVQVMYSPQLQYVPAISNMRSMHQLVAYDERITVPVLSNRIDFTIDAHLLSLVGK